METDTPQAIPTAFDTSDIKELIEAFKSTPLYAHELREEYFRKVGLAGGAADGQSGDVILNLHPRTIDNDVKYYRELFSKLKFNFLEQETKEKFLKAILQEPPLVIETKDNRELELKNQDQKEILKASKTTTETLKTEIPSTTLSLCETHDKLSTNVNKTAQMIDEIRVMEANLARIHAEESKRSKITLEEAQRILADQTASLQQINTAMEQRRMNILDLTWTLDGLSKEIGQLAPERTAAESFAAEAVRMAKQRDPKVEELCKWYNTSTQVYWKMAGIQSMEWKSDTELVVTYGFGPDGTVFISQLRVEFDSKTKKVTDAKVMDRDCNISDLVQFARSYDGLRILVNETLARLRRMHAV